jgi:L-alanine-DL-glutamate epimerase-like enolase superfamily enzyme
VKITEIATVVLRLPEVRAIGDGTQDVLLVFVHTDAGVTGLGEVHTSPTVAEAIIHAPVSHVRSRGLASVLVGQDPLRIDELWRRMQEATEVYGRRGVAIHAISGVDLALWDLRGKVEGVCVAELLGGVHHPTLSTYASVLMPDHADDASDLAIRCASAGFSAVKYGWGGLAGGLAHVTDLVGAVRNAAPDAGLMIDVGSGLEFDDARRLVDAVEPFDLGFLEEPLHPDDLEGFARLSAETSIPIATGEKETALVGFRALMDHGRPDIVQPDLARAEGFSEVERIWDEAVARSVRVVPHCWSTDVLVAATAQFLGSRPEPIPLEFCLEDNPLRRDLITEPLCAVDGQVTVPRGPGLGIELDRAVVERHAVSWSHPADRTLAGAAR